MTTRQFIANTIGVESYKERFCSSVFTDHKGVVYSYGYHYPLAVVFGNYGFVNNRGYSVTTAKHINWAYSAIHDNGLKAYGVPLLRGESMNLASLLKSAIIELEYLQKTMAGKKRKDTRVFELLEFQASTMAEAVSVLTDLNKQEVIF